MALLKKLLAPSNYWEQLQSCVLFPGALIFVALILTSAYYLPSIPVVVFGFILSGVITVKMYRDFEQMVHSQAVNGDFVFCIPSSYSRKAAAALIVSYVIAVVISIDDIVIADLVSAAGTEFLSVVIFWVLLINACFWSLIRRKVQKNWTKIKKKHYSERTRRSRPFKN